MDDLLERCAWDTAFYAQHFAQIVNEDTELVPMRFRRGQLKVEAARLAQARAGKPQRIITLKSRRVGISSGTVVETIRRITLMANRRAQVVAQDNDTAGELFDIGTTMFDNLPDDPVLKPRTTQRRNSLDRKQLGLENGSKLSIDTAKEVQAGRGKTITDLHATEVAFWPDPRKALSLLNAVADRPGTYVHLESTANGHNAWKGRWDRAESGFGGFVAVFIGWLEDEKCWLDFETPDERELFERELGHGEYGVDEPRLLERFGAKLEQLNWRRRAIVDKCDGNLAYFKQEYPTTPLEAFVGSGKHVFSILFIENAEDRARDCDPPKPTVEQPSPGDGLLIPSGFRKRELATMTVEAPTGALWLPAAATDYATGKEYWRVWEHPVKEDPEKPDVPEGRYVVAVDVATGRDQTSGGDPDYHAIQVIDHRTLEQVAEFQSRADRDLLMVEALLAGLYFNEALVAVEMTGGVGLSVVEGLWKRYGYRRLFRRRPVGQIRERQQQLLGWDTNRKTKPAMEDTLAELLREGSAGIRSMRLISELKTYVKHDNGRNGADDDAHDDLLMAFMVAQRVARVERPRMATKAGGSFSAIEREF